MNAFAQAIDSCRDLTSRMIDAARGGDWDTVSSLDQQRRPCFAGLDVASLDMGDLEKSLDGFRALMAMDGQLRSMAESARSQAIGELRQARGRQRATARYHDQAVRG